MQDLESAVDLLQRAEGYVDPGREPRLLLCLRHNRVEGDREAARTGLVEVRHEFLAREMSYDAALVSLELALLSIEDGRTAEVQELAEEMTLLFQSLDVQPEFFAALAMFQQTAALESATAASVRQILALLEKARGEPETMAS